MRKTNIYRYRQLLLHILLCGVVNDLIALPEDFIKPISIESDRVELDENNGVTTYSGNVKLHQGSLILSAVTLTVQFKEDKLHKISAFGAPVDFQQELNTGCSVKGNGAKLEYWAQKNVVTLFDDAKLVQNKTELVARKISYNLLNGKLLSKGKTRTILNTQRRRQDPCNP